jgi:dihydrolipoamide dehydrogenase
LNKNKKFQQLSYISELKDYFKKGKDIMILADKKTHKIIGASCIGAEAPELISEIALAMQHGLTVHDVGETIHSHPTISEMVLEGAEDVFGMAIHKKGRPVFH